MATKQFKVAIVGAGPGGVSCALGLIEARIPALLIDKNLNCGGQLIQIPSPILNFAGTTWSNGNVAQKALEQSLIEASHKAINENCELTYWSAKTVTDITTSGTIQLQNDTVRADYVVLAPGYRQKKLTFKGTETAHSHVYYHTSKASIAHLSSKVAVVVGGGDSAVLEALSLKSQCKSVYLVPRSDLSKARLDLQLRVKNAGIEVITQSQISELIDGQSGLRAVVLDNKQNGKTELLCDFVVIKAGYQPNTEFLQGAIDLDNSQHIQVNAQLNCYKNGAVQPHIFALGDAVASRYEAPRIARSVGQGMQVASTISRLLSESK